MEETKMGCAKNAPRCAAIVFGIAFALSGCSTTGKIGQMSKFDITKASTEDIADALKKDGRVAISGGILFQTDSAKLAPGAGDLVTRLADVMKKNPNLKVAVVGHTDNTGDFKYNLQLSERRAKAFVDALVKAGVGPDRLAAVGVGPLSPVASNDTEEGRSENRRVELVLIS
jgi:outer membrane protein OmpA-like peptidoglycan-associated protein